MPIVPQGVGTAPPYYPNPFDVKHPEYKMSIYGLNHYIVKQRITHSDDDSSYVEYDKDGKPLGEREIP